MNRIGAAGRRPAPAPRAAALALLIAAACLGGCAARGQDEPPAALFDSRLPYEPLLEKLKASGGDPAKVLHPQTAADLLALMPNRRHKFVVLTDGRLAIAPLPEAAKANEYAHPVLALGAPVRTAGGLRVERDGPDIQKVVVDQGSQAYCPTAESLAAALRALANIGVPPDRLRVDNRPVICTGAATDGQPRYGEVMTDVARHFEHLGRAGVARRWDYALFEVGELEEIFREDLPRAQPPDETGGVDLAGLAASWRNTHPSELKESIRRQDPRAFGRAFEQAAMTCNGCHRETQHPFIEVPEKPGREVPSLEPLVPGRGAR
jgi:hypothetical protein